VWAPIGITTLSFLIIDEIEEPNEFKSAGDDEERNS